MCVITIIINQYIAVWLPVGVELILQIQWVIINSSFCVQIHVKIKLKNYRLPITEKENTGENRLPFLCIISY